MVLVSAALIVTLVQSPSLGMPIPPPEVVRRDALASERRGRLREMYSAIPQGVLGLQGIPQTIRSFNGTAEGQVQLELSDSAGRSLRFSLLASSSSGECASIRMARPASDPFLIDIPVRGPEEDALLGLLFRADVAEADAARRRPLSERIEQRQAIKLWIELLGDRAVGVADCGP